MGMHQAEAFRAEIERLKPLIKSGEPFMTTIPEALAQARGEVIHELIKRPSLTLSQIEWLLCAARSTAGSQVSATEEVAVARECVETLNRLRAELMTNEEDG